MARSLPMLPGLAALLLAWTVSCGPSAGPEAEPRAPAPDETRFERIILVTIDTLRADHLQSYGYFRQTSPFLDELGSAGVVFDKALASSSHTAPSHASIFTGMLPGDHGVLGNGQALPNRAVTLARMAREAGYETAAFASVGFLRFLGLGFEIIDCAKRSGQLTTDAAIRWLAERQPGNRFFLWLHLYDPHRWYRGEPVPEEHLRAIAAQGPQDSATLYAELARRHALPDPDGPDGPLDWGPEEWGLSRIDSRQDIVRWIEEYDARIRLADAHVRELYEAVLAAAGGHTSLWIVTSDHGEGLGSHGYSGHGRHMYNEQLHVPLIVAASDGSLGPFRVPAVVQHLDLFPTLADLLGQSPPARPRRRTGRSLLPLLEGAGWEIGPRLAYAQRRPVSDNELGLGWKAEDVFSVQDERFKVVLHSAGDDELFDLAADPLELQRLDPEQSTEGAELASQLRARIEHLRHRNADAVQLSELDPETLKELQELGYIR